jgi:hypothetical protein
MFNDPILKLISITMFPYSSSSYNQTNFGAQYQPSHHQSQTRDHKHVRFHLDQPSHQHVHHQPSYQHNHYQPSQPSQPSHQHNYHQPGQPSHQHNHYQPSQPSHQHNHYQPSQPSHQHDNYQPSHQHNHYQHDNYRPNQQPNQQHDHYQLNQSGNNRTSGGCCGGNQNYSNMSYRIPNSNFHVHPSNNGKEDWVENNSPCDLCKREFGDNKYYSTEFRGNLFSGGLPNRPMITPPSAKFANKRLGLRNPGHY